MNKARKGFRASERRLLEKGSDKVAYDILKQLADGSRRPAELRAALGIASANFFTARYLTPLTKSGYIAKGPQFEFEKLPGVKQRFYGVNRWDSDWHLNALIAVQCH